MKARIKFEKTGSMKFIGHLDVMRYFQKALKRAKIDVGYSEGFNPHQLMSFASPLGLGLTSCGEYLDLQLKSVTSSEDIVKRLNDVMSEELRVLDFKVLPEDAKTSMSILAACDYKITLRQGYHLWENFRQELDAFLGNDTILFTKKTKKSTKEVDLKQSLYEYKIDYEAEEFSLFMQVTSGSVFNVKPELYLQAFYESKGMEYSPFTFEIHRLEMYADTNAKKGEVNMNGSDKKRVLQPLSEFGETVS
ncbi:MAG: TIGR03936 family radical SAM-associated protein [Lachnospiraceae bacterium]|nr:TIGR03936 family radical SAM-associated protein [Lachnospiraceae bacterium]